MSAFQRRAALIAHFYAERNREYPLNRPALSIGRSRDSALRIADPRIALQHARIERTGPSYVLEAVAEEAPTRLNGEALTPGERRTLAHGDTLGLADFEFRFVRVPDAPFCNRIRVLAGVHRGKVFRIDRDEVLLGRAVDNDVQFPDRSVSRHHCLIRQGDGGWLIEDLGSTNGTVVNGTFLRAAVPLRYGDQVLAGYSRFRFERGEGPTEAGGPTGASNGRGGPEGWKAP